MIPVPGHPDVVVRYEDMVVFEAKASGRCRTWQRRGPDAAGQGDARRCRYRRRPDAPPMPGFRSSGLCRPSSATHTRTSGSGRSWNAPQAPQSHRGAAALDRSADHGRNGWKDQIDENLERADLILLLVSADFMNSDYCYDIELKRALERHEAKEARVVPIIVRKVAWHSAPFGKLQALPADGKVVDRGRWPSVAGRRLGGGRRGSGEGAARDRGEGRSPRLGKVRSIE